ncbi:LacI family DNA-binding transcriptional regulator [Pelagibacterium sp.]|uniref:LacI family DNA-binding transcriptional regulator n=1 Tax=Pelagibacterium sp. TaxID=1967288 RepID=UPI003A95B653
MSKAGSRPTIKTIAQETGLSTATVSKGLKSSPQVRPETQELIKSTALRLGYQANLHGVQLRTGRTYQVAVVMQQPGAQEEEWEGVEYAQMLSGIAKAFEGSPYRMTLFTAHDFEENLETVKQIVQHRRADGVIIAGTTPSDPRIAYMLDHDFPFVSYGTSRSERPHPFVDTDNAAILRTCLERLIGKGHSRIALINPPQNYTYALTRLETYAAVLDENGLDMTTDYVSHGRLTPAYGRSQVARLASLANPPTAYVCANEASALGVMSGFHAQGLVHGKDAVINATDDLNVSEYFSPPITTFYLPIHEPSALLGEFIIRRIEGARPEALQKLCLPRLIERSDDVLG